MSLIMGFWPWFIWELLLPSWLILAFPISSRGDVMSGMEVEGPLAFRLGGRVEILLWLWQVSAYAERGAALSPAHRIQVTRDQGLHCQGGALLLTSSSSIVFKDEREGKSFAAHFGGCLLPMAQGERCTWACVPHKHPQKSHTAQRAASSSLLPPGSKLGKLWPRIMGRKVRRILTSEILHKWQRQETT